MKTVSFTALAALLLSANALASELKPVDAGAPLHANACLDLRAYWSHTALGPLATTHCCYGDTHCAQFISTERMVPKPRRDRT